MNYRILRIVYPALVEIGDKGSMDRLAQMSRHNYTTRNNTSTRHVGYFLDLVSSSKLTFRGTSSAKLDQLINWSLLRRSLCRRDSEAWCS